MDVKPLRLAEIILHFHFVEFTADSSDSVPSVLVFPKRVSAPNGDCDDNLSQRAVEHLGGGTVIALSEESLRQIREPVVRLDVFLGGHGL